MQLGRDAKVEMRRVVCVEFFIFGGSLLGRIQGDREPVSFLRWGSVGYVL